MVREKESRHFLDRMLRRHAHALEKAVGAYTHDVETLTPIHPEYVASVLDEEAADDAVFTVQYDLPVKVVVFNNSSLGMVDLEMMVDGLPPHGTAYPRTDYAAIATAAGARGIRVDRPGALRGALREAFAHDGPALVDVVTDPDALAIPPRTTAEQVSGFALSAGRSVLTGGVGRMIHLARTNLRNIPRP